MDAANLPLASTPAPVIETALGIAKPSLLQQHAARRSPPVATATRMKPGLY